jgi:1-phosphofructokinase/tagatose 6-phosphate kinase
MILCVAGNPSIDKLFEVAEIAIGEIHRPDRTIALPGGKGIHVGQVATALGAEAVVTGLLAGHAGRWVEQMLAAEGVVGEWAWGAGETRSSLSVADAATGRLTEFYEDGAVVSGEEWRSVRAIVDSLLPAADWIALAGSLPKGATGYPELIEAALGHGVRGAVDSRGAALAEAVDAGAELVKINVHEAAELLDREIGTDGDAIPRALEDVRARAGGDGHAVAITLGEKGAVLVDPDGATWRGTCRARGRYPVGGGDTFLAGMLVGLTGGGSWADALRVAVGAAAANAEVPGAARFTAERARELAAQAEVTPLS